MTTNAVISERALREVYLRCFEIAIEKGCPWTMMTAYNQVNGDWVNSSKHLMKEILREEWGYDGIVMSDALAVHKNKAEAHRCGMDMETADAKIHNHFLLEAVNAGEFPVSRVDEIVRRILRLQLFLHEKAPLSPPDLDAGHELARRAEENSMVLLENDGLLPLDPDSGSIAVIGSFAKYPDYMGGGSGYMNGRLVENAWDEMQKLAGKSLILRYAPGYPIESGNNFQPGNPCKLDPYGPEAEALLEEAVSAACGADAALVFVGTPFPVECEAFDRENLFLPELQRRLIERVLEVNRRTVLIVSTGSASDLSAYSGKAAAILETWFGGEAMGSATARVLFGLAEPGRRLSETFPLRLEDTPSYHSFPMGDCYQPDILYSEDIYVGHRWYEKKKLPVLYPFGHGLSYTTFEISDLKVFPKEFTPDEPVQVSVHIKNTGNRSGSQVLQLYVRDPEASADRPEKELKAFCKVFLRPGEDTDAVMTLDRRAFTWYSTQKKDWIAEDGAFELLLGISSRNILLRETIILHSGEQPIRYVEMTPLGWFLKDPRFKEVISAYPPEVGAFCFNPMIGTAMPIYRLTEPRSVGLQFSPSLLSPEELREILCKMNRENQMIS